MSQDATPHRFVPKEHQSPVANGGSTLQSDQPELTTASAITTACTHCKEIIGQIYYTLANKVLCKSCCDTLLAARQASSPLLRAGKATMSGMLAAIAGSALYCVVFMLTGYEFGLIAIVVGVLIGRAVKWGAQNRGGLGYQMLAVFLTYCAIVSSYIPPMIYEFRRNVTAQAQQNEGQAVIATSGAGALKRQHFQDPNVGETPVAQSSHASAQEVDELTQRSTIQLALLMLPFAFFAPIFSGIDNLIGVIIIGIGLYEAWKLNTREVFEVTGPFTVNTASPQTSAQ